MRGDKVKGEGGREGGRERERGKRVGTQNQSQCTLYMFIVTYVGGSKAPRIL